MKKVYSTPVMYREAYILDQYIAASNCGTHITVTPSHGHVQIKGSNEIHCAFTSSNCGANATGCLANGTSSECTSAPSPHQVISSGTNLNSSRPSSGHNCHILDNHDDAVYFANNYKDEICGDGVARLLGLQDFKDIETAWS